MESRDHRRCVCSERRGSASLIDRVTEIGGPEPHLRWVLLEELDMKIVVIGGSGLIGSRLVSILRAGGHQVLAASPDSGVNTITGEGLDAALRGAEVVVDVANSPSFEDSAVKQFFETSGTN